MLNAQKIRKITDNVLKKGKRDKQILKYVKKYVLPKIKKAALEGKERAYIRIDTSKVKREEVAMVLVDKDYIVKDAPIPTDLKIYW